MFTVCGATNALVFWAFFPETKGRTLEEMDDFFKRGRSFIAFDKEATTGRSARDASEVVKGEAHQLLSWINYQLTVDDSQSAMQMILSPCPTMRRRQPIRNTKLRRKATRNVKQYEKSQTMWHLPGYWRSSVFSVKSVRLSHLSRCG